MNKCRYITITPEHLHFSNCLILYVLKSSTCTHAWCANKALLFCTLLCLCQKISIQSWFFWQRWKKKNIHWHTHADIQPITAASYRVCLILATVELMAVIKDVFIGGVETGFDTVLHYLTGSGWRLELLDLNAGTKIRHAVTGSFIWAHIWNDEFITAAEDS